MMYINNATSNQQHYPDDINALSSTPKSSVARTMPLTERITVHWSTSYNPKEASDHQTFLFLKKADTVWSTMICDNNTAATVVVPSSPTVMTDPAPAAEPSQFDEHHCFNIATMLPPNYPRKSRLQISKLMDKASDLTPCMCPTQINSSDEELSLHLLPLLKQFSAADNIALGNHYMWPSFNYIKVPLMFGEYTMKQL